MIERTFDSYLALIEDYLDNSIEKSCYGEEIVADAMRYSLQNGGKRIRPVLVLEFCRLCGGDVEKALPFAAAIEPMPTAMPVKTLLNASGSSASLFRRSVSFSRGSVSFASAKRTKAV